jgi:hypothetical protein
MFDRIYEWFNSSAPSSAIYRFAAESFPTLQQFRLVSVAGQQRIELLNDTKPLNKCDALAGVSRAVFRIED